MCGVRMREDPTRPKEPDPPLTTDREGFRERGEGETGGSRDERRPNPTKGNQTPLTMDREGFREDGEGDLWIQMNWRGELVVRVGFGD